MIKISLYNNGRKFHIRCNLSAFVTTKSDERLIAAAPIMGLSVIPNGTKTPIATGIPSEL